MPRVDGLTLQKKQRNQYLPSLLLYKGVPRTNQSVVYLQGDDGTYQTGVESQIPRLVDNGDGTITDLATGLMWVADPSAIGGVWGSLGNPSLMTLENALQNTKNLSYAGHSDWRMPNVKELETLTDYSKYNPAIDNTKFKNAKSGGYHSSSISLLSCENPYFIIGKTGECNWGYPGEMKYVRPVRVVPTGHRVHTRGK